MPGIKFVVTMALYLGVSFNISTQNSSYKNNKLFGMWPKYYS
jgi:hypothetical protein